MKSLYLFCLLSVLLVLSACNSSYVMPEKHLPQKSAAAPSTGILAIPKSMKSDNGVTLLAGYANQIVVTNEEGEAISKPIRLVRHEGCQLDYLKELVPGKYFVSTFETVPHINRYEYSGGNKPYAMNLPFEIKAGYITVLPINFHVIREGDGLFSASSRVTVRKVNGEVKSEFMDILLKEKHLKDWEVIWAGDKGKQNKI